MILFVCTEGRIRSRTAEVLSLLGGMSARSCGTAIDALAPIRPALVYQADTIICMERRHADAIRALKAANDKCIVSLGITDTWDPFDPGLIEELVRLIHLRLGDSTVSDAIHRGNQLRLSSNMNY